MKRKFNVLLLCLAVLSLIVISGCERADEVCKDCSLDYRKEKKVSQILYYDETATLTEKYRFFYTDALLDSVTKVSYMGGKGAKVAASDSIISTLKVYYPSGECIPSFYEAKTYVPGDPVSMEKGIMSLSGNLIVNRHLAYYDDITLPVTSDTDEIDYTYNGLDQVLSRNGTDYGLLVWPGPYGNENYYTYTGPNLSHVDAWKEQAGYDLDKTFDNGFNPFNIQSGVMYYLTLIAYTDQEYFETICLDKNNVTKMIYKGTDTSNSFVTKTFTFTYSYSSDRCPLKVHIYEVEENEVYGDSEQDHGTYTFTYY